MKKIYIAPNTVLKTVRAKQAMLAGSNRLYNNGVGETAEFNPGTMIEGDGDDAAARNYRSSSVWDD